MSTYTITLKEVIDLYTIDEGANVRDKIELGRTKLFDFDYPIFDESYRKVFETKFIRNFFMREIGFETEGLFKFQLETWLSINMPYFNKLFESELISFDPLSNTKLNDTSTKHHDVTNNQSSLMDGTNSGSTNQTANGSLTEDNFDRQLESDTPDGRLGLTATDGTGVIEYANNIKENNENNSKTSTNTTTGSTNDSSHVTSSSNGTINTTEDYVASKIGKVGSQSFSSMVNEYRDSFIRIEKRIFKEMQELFMLVY
jgi:hypothetical protein